MLAPSSPIAFPATSSPVKDIESSSSSSRLNKRPRPANPGKDPKRRAVAGFLAEDDSDSDDEENHDENAAPSPKRRMLEHAGSEVEGNGTTSTTTAEDTATATQPAEDDEDSDEELQRYNRLFGPSQSQSQSQPPRASTTLPSFLQDDVFVPAAYGMSTCSGKTIPIRERKPTENVSYATMVAARSRTKEGRAKKSYFGIDVHALLDEANASKSVPELPRPTAHPDKPVRSVEEPSTKKKKKTLLWTEKYRAKHFMDLVGDDLTNRQVLRWLKRWDPIVFPHSAKKTSISRRQQQAQAQGQPLEEEKPHRKILMLHGPPGLGKTTLAHVCARQAGYEVLEINASDDRSRDVVKGRIRTTLGTETVRTVENKKAGKIARPVCVVVDEVDGVVSGSGAGGEGGFVKALIDLVMIDQKNAAGAAASSQKKKKGDDFRQMRPLVLICNDVYHPSLRPLRQSGLAEVIHVGKPSVEAVVTRLKSVFEKEGIPCEKDAARKLCEAAWGMTSGLDARKGAEGNAEGDLRGVMVVGEWVAGRLKASGTPTLTRQWIDKNIVADLAHGGGGARGLGRGGVKEIVNRIFQEGAGFPKQNLSHQQSQTKVPLHEQPSAQLGFSEQQKKYAMARLREMIDTCGEIDRIMTDVFLEYPNRDFNDDSFLTKPDAAYEWLYFHDTCSSRIFSAQEWELAQYISQPILACHHLFACARRHEPQYQDDKDVPEIPFRGPRADFAAREAEKVNRAQLQGIQASLPANLYRAFRSPEHIATDFLPFLVRMVSPDVKPVLIGGSDKDKGSSIASVRRESEKIMVRRAAEVMAECGIGLVKGRLEGDTQIGGRVQWVYRMEPDLDALSTFETAGTLLSAQAPTRYAVCQVLDQELKKAIAGREMAARQARLRQGGEYHVPVQQLSLEDDKENKNTAPEGEVKAVKKDFFGRIIEERPLGERSANGGHRRKGSRRGGEEKEWDKVWVTYHEGINNAVRKPISLEEFMRGF
ncbi:putative chromosome transmission fidelity protein 18 [Podospora australis]|uniref:Chromosome transmission fidelity protein 18 n=1 Tax=Podospora australis TaxID=1536484 RepID=A0AAN6WJF0_9PEZI|nr:putative chromosome transmission fidelity protein 18 [Podospora australis]